MGDYVDFDHFSILNQSAFTVMVELKPDYPLYTGGVIADNTIGGMWYFMVSEDEEPEEIQFQVNCVSVDGGGGNWKRVYAPIEYDNQFHTYVAVYDPNYGISIYKDGILIEFEVFTCSALRSDIENEFMVGGPDSSQDDQRYHGQINSLKIWNYAFSNEDIFNNIFDITPGLVADWNYNFDNQNSFHDYSDRQNHGTINGATWVCNDMDLCGVCGGDNSTCTIISDIDGNEYGTVQIGEQLWMADNLKVTHYNDGSEIPTGLDPDAWGSTIEGAYASVDDNNNNTDIYGNLYNGYAVFDNRGICPAGWNVPSGDDFNDLINFLGENAGGKLKETGFDYWNAPNTGATNEVGFNGRGSGTRNAASGSFNHFNNQGIYWAQTENTEGLPTYHEHLVLFNHSSNLVLGGSAIGQGCPVRCLEDEITTGCTHPNATNYDEIANVDDGSCEYETVQIGHQVWMQENLKATHYRNGDAIPTGLDNDAWGNTTDGAYAIYPYDNEETPPPDCGNDCAEAYGNLYNWYSVNDDRGICPDEFHVPSDEEFMEMEIKLDMSAEEANSYGWRGTNEGSKLAGNTELWQSGYLVDNSEFGTSGFNALPAGYRHYNNGFAGMGSNVSFWSSSETDNSYALERVLSYHLSSVARDGDKWHYGFSIRCLSDYTQTTTLLVPDNFAAIQEAIDYSIDGDTILVSAGTYFENINFNGKNIALIGEDRETTIIDGNQNGSVVTFNSGEASTSVLSGFTIQNGYSNDGAGIWVLTASPTLENLIIQYNQGNHGGGIYFHEGSHSYVRNVIIRENNVVHHAGGVYCNEFSNPKFEYVTIYNNSADNGAGGLASDQNSYPELYNCTFANNYSNPHSQTFSTQRAITLSNGGKIKITNSIIYGNSPDGIQMFENYCGNCFADIKYSCVEGIYGDEGDTSLDSVIYDNPQFTDPDNGDFTLQPSSSCIDAGDPESELDPDGTISDMGAYPFYQIPGCIDELACNYDDISTINDGTCDYACHDNGDYSLQFDGDDDFVIINESNSLNNLDELTMEISILVNEGQENTSILTKGNNKYLYWDVDFEDDYLPIQEYQGFQIEPNGYEGGSAETFNMEYNEWYTLTWLYDNDSNDLRIYKNGEYVRTENAEIDFNSGNQELIFGIWEHSSNDFRGKLSNLKIWNKALTNEEVSLNYIGTENNEILVAHYRFGEGDSTILYDHSGNGNHGTINGATWSTDVPVFEQEINGCTAPYASNYDETANVDDGSCEYETVQIGHQVWMTENLKTTHYRNGDALLSMMVIGKIMIVNV